MYRDRVGVARLSLLGLAHESIEHGISLCHRRVDSVSLDFFLALSQFRSSIDVCVRSQSNRVQHCELFAKKLDNLLIVRFWAVSNWVFMLHSFLKIKFSTSN